MCIKIWGGLGVFIWTEDVYKFLSFSYFNIIETS